MKGYLYGLITLMLLQGCLSNNNKEVVEEKVSNPVNDSITISDKFFVLTDHLDFLNDSYGKYIVYSKEIAFSNNVLVIAIKSYDSNRINIVSVSHITLADGHQKLGEDLYDVKAKRGYLSNKISRSIDVDSVMSMTKILDSFVSMKALNTWSGNEDEPKSIFYYDGRSRHDLSSENLPHEAIYFFNNYLLDSVLHLDARYGYPKK